jgi:UDP-N-acetylglucosamine:LPS N-acetylglucosamine transferase
MKRVLLISSNGTGLGHLTRSMAIARRLTPMAQPILLSMSRAVGVARDQGFYCEYFTSPDAPSPGSYVHWDRRLGRRLDELIDAFEPAAIVFDGVNPYRPVRLLRASHDITTVWCRRAMWIPGVGADKLAATANFDVVLEPGEFAAEADQGLTVAKRDGVRRVGPIVYLDDDELLPRAQAAAELGLDPDRPAALVQLGAGGAEIEEIARHCVARLSQEEDLQVAVLESAISASLSLPGHVKVLRSTYPMSRFYSAFDFAVSASGYNAFHELVQFGVPALWVPMPRQMDDQGTRARYAEQVGVGRIYSAAGDTGLEQGLADLLDPAKRQAMHARLAELHMPNGAADAARAIAELAG